MRTAAMCPTCATYENAICVLYDGPYLPCTGISPLDSIAEALAKIDAAICALGGTTTSSTTSTTSTTTTAGPTTTTTTTTVNSCTAPVITDISTNGAYPEATVTIDYNVNGIVDVLSLTLWYSLDPNFEGTVFTDVISNLNLTSYSFPMTGTSTWYFKLRKVCGTDPEFPTGESYSNVVSIAPQPTTTTTTTTLNCVYPTLDNLTTDGFGNMTLTYDLHGSSCSGVFAEYSSDSGFPDPVSGQIIFNGCNLTSYVLNVPSESTLYVRVSTTCGQLSLIGNALSIIPGVPTTTTTTTVV